jgi:hypothetical protein
VKSLRNMTITVENEVARWARLKAAREEISVSQLVGRMLKEHMLSEEGYESAKKRFLSVRPRVLSDGSSYPTRDELHDRPRLR